MKKTTIFILTLSILVNVTSFGKTTRRTSSKSTIKKQVSGTRYGSKTVGYVTKPSDWINFFDPNSSQNTVQIAKDPIDIVTLDVVEGGGQLTSNEVALIIQEKYLNSGVEKENITIKDATLNGYKGKKVKINFPDGTVYILNCIDYNGNVYFVSQEGFPEYQEELSKVVETWNPVK